MLIPFKCWTDIELTLYSGRRLFLALAKLTEIQQSYQSNLNPWPIEKQNKTNIADIHIQIILDLKTLKGGGAVNGPQQNACVSKSMLYWRDWWLAAVFIVFGGPLISSRADLSAHLYSFRCLRCLKDTEGEREHVVTDKHTHTHTKENLSTSEDHS